MIAAGNFRARAVSDLQIGDTKGGKQQAVVTFKLEDGPDAGSLVTWYGNLDGEGAKFTAAAFAAMGYDGEDESSVKKNEVSLKLQIKPNHEGVDRCQVSFVNPIGGAFTASAPDKAAQAKQRIKAMLLANKAKNGAAPAPTTDTGTAFDPDKF